MSLQLVVTYNDHTIQYHPLGPDKGWRIDNPSRCVVVGAGLPRTYIPLDQVRCFAIERVSRPPAPAAPNGCDDCSVEPGERHRYYACPGAERQLQRDAAEVRS